MALEQLNKKQVKIVRQVRSMILDTLAESGKTVGKTMLISDVYRALAQNFAVPVHKLADLGNELIWSALYLLELQGWIRLDAHYPRLLVLRERPKQHVEAEATADC